MTGILTFLVILLLLLLVLRIAHSRKFMATLIVHHMHRTTANRWAALLPNMVLNLMLHPVLIDSFRAGLRGALFTCSDRVTVLHLHLEHATLVFGRVTRGLEAARMRNGVL